MLETGIVLLGIANELGKVEGAEGAATWLLEYSAWCTKWSSFLKEYTLKDGKKVYTHERLRKARRGLEKLVRVKAMLTFAGMQREHGGERPSTDNAVAGVNARLRDMLRHHRGLPCSIAPRPSSGGAA